MSNDSGSLLTKPSVGGRLKKSNGSAPVERRLLTSWLLICVSRAAPPAVVESGWPLAVAQTLYSAAVRFVSVGRLVKLSEFRRKFGWLKALIKSTRKLMRRWLSLPKGNGKSFWNERSKYSCRGERMLSVRGALPRLPLAGRLNAAGLTNGSHGSLVAGLVPVGQSRLHSGFLSGTPSMMSGRTTRLLPPRRLVSTSVGRKGVEPGMRKT